MSKPLVSIVIPCYNSEKWIAEAVQSALDQTWPDTEVIVIDDGSKDGSVKAIESFGTRIRWETGPNRGGGAARNRGIELAEGQWIQFLDSDDVLTPTCVQLKVEASPKPGEAICNAVRNLSDGSQEGLPKSWFRPEHPLASMLAEGSPATPAPLLSRADLLAVGGFRPELRCAQEFDLHLRLSIILGLKFVVTPEVGALVRPTQGSVSRAAGIRMPKTTAEILFNCARLLEERNRLESRYREIIAQRCTVLARKLWRLGQHEAASEVAGKAKELSSHWYENAYLNRVATAAARFGGFEFYEKFHDGWRKFRRSDAV